MKKIVIWMVVIVTIAVLAGCGAKPSPYGKYIDPDNPKGGAFDLRPDGKIYFIVDGSEKASMPYTISGNIVTIKNPKGETLTVTIKGNTLTFEENGRKVVLVKEGVATESEKTAARESISPQRIAANETAAQGNLKVIMSSQMSWRQMDADNNVQRDYWTYDISCLYRMKDAAGNARKFIDMTLAKADVKPADAKLFEGKIEDWGSIKPEPKYGYSFQAMTTDESGGVYNQNELNGVKVANDYKFAFVAYPAEYDKTGKRTFIVNETGTVYGKDTGGQPVLQWPAADPVSAGWTQER